MHFPLLMDRILGHAIRDDNTTKYLPRFNDRPNTRGMPCQMHQEHNSFHFQSCCIHSSDNAHLAASQEVRNLEGNLRGEWRPHLYRAALRLNPCSRPYTISWQICHLLGKEGGCHLLGIKERGCHLLGKEGGVKDKEASKDSKTRGNE